METQNLDIEYPKNSNDLIKLKNYEPIFVIFSFKFYRFIFKKRQKNLKFNVNECVTKCVVQLLLIGTIKDIIDQFLQQLSDEVLTIFIF